MLEAMTMMNDTLHRIFDRDVINLESYQLVWLDIDANGTSEETEVLLAKLRNIIDYTQIFVNPEECLQYIKKTEDTTTFFVGSNIHDATILSKMSDLSNVCVIRFYSPHDKVCEKLIRQFPKVRILS